jgi:hypothetical protein
MPSATEFPSSLQQGNSPTRRHPSRWLHNNRLIVAESPADYRPAGKVSAATQWSTLQFCSAAGGRPAGQNPATDHEPRASACQPFRTQTRRPVVVLKHILRNQAPRLTTVWVPLVTLLWLPIVARHYFHGSTGRAYGVGLTTKWCLLVAPVDGDRDPNVPHRAFTAAVRPAPLGLGSGTVGHRYR